MNEANQEVDEEKKVKKVAELMKKQHDKYKKALEAAKKAAVDKAITKEKRDELKLVAAREQKKMITIKNEITAKEDQKEKAAVQAKEQAYEEETKRNAIPLEQTEKVELYNEIKKITFIRPSKDAKELIKQKKDAIARAQEFYEKHQREMFKQRDVVKLYQEKAKKLWEQRMKQMKMDHSNMMITTTVVEGKEAPKVFKKVETVTEVVEGQPQISVDPVPVVPVKKYIPVVMAHKEFKEVHTGKMCIRYNQLSINSQSEETCGELVKENKGKCASGHGHFMYGDVSATHKECACCTGAAEDIVETDMRASPHFNIFKLNHSHAGETVEKSTIDEAGE